MVANSDVVSVPSASSTMSSPSNSLRQRIGTQTRALKPISGLAGMIPAVDQPVTPWARTWPIAWLLAWRWSTAWTRTASSSP